MNNDYDECEPVTWDIWKYELREHLGIAEIEADGWGECFAAGLTPAEAILCRDTGFRQDFVKTYCYGDDTPLQFGSSK